MSHRDTEPAEISERDATVLIDTALAELYRAYKQARTGENPVDVNSREYILLAELGEHFVVSIEDELEEAVHDLESEEKRLADADIDACYGDYVYDMMRDRKMEGR